MKLGGDRNQCQGCKQYFNSTYAFDLHRRGTYGVDRRCLTITEMEDKGMLINGDGFWISGVNYRVHNVWVPPTTATTREAGNNREAEQLTTKAFPLGKGLEGGTP
jgi:hypothetical protein